MLYLVDLNHAQFDLIVLNMGDMLTVNCQKDSFFVYNAKIASKSNDASPSIATHCSFSTVSIAINHLKIKIFCILKSHETISSDAEPSITHFLDYIDVVDVKMVVSIVDKDKIIASSLIF